MTVPAVKSSVVLVVDDEPLLRMNACDMLADAGFETVEAGGSEEALGQLDSHPEVSVLFTDINMPGSMDGLDLARRVHERRPDIQLIITSGRRAPLKPEIPDDGQFISKPYGAAALVRLIAKQRPVD